MMLAGTSATAEVLVLFDDTTDEQIDQFVFTHFPEQQAEENAKALKAMRLLLGDAAVAAECNLPKVLAGRGTFCWAAPIPRYR